jgi:hypothetical protein
MIVAIERKTCNLRSRCADRRIRPKAALQVYNWGGEAAICRLLMAVETRMTLMSATQ